VSKRLVTPERCGFEATSGYGALEDSDGPGEELATVLRAPLRASAGVDVNRTMLIAAVDVAFGRKARL
jgi:hypothetical protein